MAKEFGKEFDGDFSSQDSAEISIATTEDFEDQIRRHGSSVLINTLEKYLSIGQASINSAPKKGRSSPSKKEVLFAGRLYDWTQRMDEEWEKARAILLQIFNKCTLPIGEYLLKKLPSLTAKLDTRFLERATEITISILEEILENIESLTTGIINKIIKKQTYIPEEGEVVFFKEEKQKIRGIVSNVDSDNDAIELSLPSGETKVLLRGETALTGTKRPSCGDFCKVEGSIPTAIIDSFNGETKKVKLIQIPSGIETEIGLEHCDPISPREADAAQHLLNSLKTSQGFDSTVFLILPKVEKVSLCTDVPSLFNLLPDEVQVQILQEIESREEEIEASENLAFFLTEEHLTEEHHVEQADDPIPQSIPHEDWEDPTHENIGKYCLVKADANAKNSNEVEALGAILRIKTWDKEGSYVLQSRDGSIVRFVPDDVAIIEQTIIIDNDDYENYFVAMNNIATKEEGAKLREKNPALFVFLYKFLSEEKRDEYKRLPKEVSVPKKNTRIPSPPSFELNDPVVVKGKQGFFGYPDGRGKATVFFLEPQPYSEFHLISEIEKAASQ